MPEMPQPDTEAASHSGLMRQNEYAELTHPGLIRAESSTSESQKTVETSQVDDLMKRSGDISGIWHMTQGLEIVILENGLQAMTDRYGADKLLDAMQVVWQPDANGLRPPSSAKNPNPTTISEVIDNLVVDKNDRAGLQAAIEGEAIDALCDRFNEVAGGLTTAGSTPVDAIERRRRYGAMDVKNGKPTDGSNILLSGDTIKTLQQHPELVEKFRDSNDTVDLLKNVREVYATEYTKFCADQDELIANIDALIATGETEIAELKSLADSIYAPEIANLQEKLAGATRTEAKTMVEAIIATRTAEQALSTKHLAERAANVRTTILAGLGRNATYIYQMKLSKPPTPAPTYQA